MSYEAQRAAVAAAAAEFPETFGLRPFPADTFRISLGASFVSEGEVQLVVQVKVKAGQAQKFGWDPTAEWMDFGRNTPAHVRRELVLRKP